MMSSPIEEQIDWVKQHIMDQVDAGIENFTILESGEGKLLEFCKVVVESTVNRIDVKHALDMYSHIAATADTISTPEDRIQCVFDYFNDWVELELARRYA